MPNAPWHGSWLAVPSAPWVSLENVRESLEGLIERTSTLAEKSNLVAASLGKIGTPELLARSSAIKDALSELAADSAKREKSLRGIVLAGLFASVTSLLISLATLTKVFIR